MKLLFISLDHKTFSKNLAQGPRPAKALLLSTDQILTNRMSYFQTRNGPLRFFKLAGRRGHRNWCAVRCGDVGSKDLLNKLQACRCVQQGHFRRSYERKTVANWPDNLDVFGGQDRVFCNPFVTQRLNGLSQSSDKSLIYMVPPHGLEPRTY